MSLIKAINRLLEIIKNLLDEKAKPKFSIEAMANGT
jgi:hypothetical protein